MQQKLPPSAATYRVPERVFSLLVCLVFGVVFTSFPQGQPALQQQPPALQFKRQSLSISYGMGAPQSRSALTSFWTGGPSVSASFFVNVSRVVAMGLGVDVSHLLFNEGAFRNAYPTVPVEASDIYLANIYVGTKISPMPTMRFSPYLTGSVGAMKMTEAQYRKVINEVRVTYYNIPGMTRLSFGIAGGVDIYISRWFALQLEAKSTYVHNDPDVGIATFFRGGFKFSM
jgi:hypothetical protein